MVITVSDVVTEFKTEPDFSKISAMDETDGVIIVSLVGDYNIAKAGIYPMNAVATDRSGNTAKVAFNVIVNEHPKQPELNEAEKNVLAKKEILDKALSELNDAKNELSNRNSALTESKNTLETLKSKTDKGRKRPCRC